ncbi:unnamed protein product [Rhodiola kirilowii]
MMFLILSFFFLMSHHAMADEKLITTTCTQTPYKQLCVSSLKSDNRSSRADTAGLALILVDKISTKTKLAIKIVTQRVKSTKDPKVVEALKQCSGLYNAVMVADVPMATEALTKGDPKFAEQGAVDASNEVESCEAGFPKGTSPVSGLNREIGQLAAVVASITKQLE